jgi:TolB protein
MLRWCVSGFAILFLITSTVVFASREILPPSEQIAFQSDQDGNWDIYLFDMRANLVHNLSQNAADDYAPAWSPDGSELIFYSDHDGDQRAELHILNLETMEILPFGEQDRDYRRAGWSPDGLQLVYTIGYGQMQLVNAEGNVIALGYGFNPRWSPDGSWILYYADSQDSLNAEIYALNTAESRLLNLTRNIANDWSPAWSPDGETIAFVTSRDGNAELYLMQNCLIATTNCDLTVRRLTDNLTNDASPSWSPDGRMLVYETLQGESNDLYVIDLATLQQHSLYATPADERSPAWRPRS